MSWGLLSMPLTRCLRAIGDREQRLRKMIVELGGGPRPGGVGGTFKVELSGQYVA